MHLPFFFLSLSKDKKINNDATIRNNSYSMRNALALK